MSQAVTRKAIGDIFDYNSLETKFSEEGIKKNRDRLMTKFSSLTKNWSKETHTIWIARDYLAIKMILSSSVMLTTAIYSNRKNLRITEPYLVYYAMLNCARAVIFTSPNIPWDKSQIVTMNHGKIINVVSDIISSFDKEKGVRTRMLLESAKDFRELFSYKFPAKGINNFAVQIEEAIDICKLFAEVAQFQSELLEKSYEKNVQTLYKLDPELLKVCYEYEGKHYTFFDDEDYYRLDYISRKQNRQFSLYLTMTEGMIEDYFGAWFSHEDNDADEDIYNPDNNWRIIFPFP